MATAHGSRNEAECLPETVCGFQKRETWLIQGTGFIQSSRIVPSHRTDWLTLMMTLVQENAHRAGESTLCHPMHANISYKSIVNINIAERNLFRTIGSVLFSSSHSNLTSGWGFLKTEPHPVPKPPSSQEGYSHNSHYHTHTHTNTHTHTHINRWQNKQTVQKSPN